MEFINLNSQKYFTKLISKPEDIAVTIEWKDRTIRAMLTIEVDNNKYNVSFNGKRYWIKKYNWKVASIKSQFKNNFIRENQE